LAIKLNYNVVDPLFAGASNATCEGRVPTGGGAGGNSGGGNNGNGNNGGGEGGTSAGYNVPLYAQTATGAGDAFESGWCGKTSVAMVVAFYKNNGFRPQDVPGLQLLGTLASETGKSYHDSGNISPADPKYFETLNAGLAKGPVVVSSGLYGKHIMVVTGYNSTTGKYSINNPNVPPTRLSWSQQDFITNKGYPGGDWMFTQ